MGKTYQYYGIDIQSGLVSTFPTTEALYGWIHEHPDTRRRLLTESKDKDEINILRRHRYAEQKAELKRLQHENEHLQTAIKEAVKGGT